MSESSLKNILEAALLAAGEPLSLARLQALFGEGEDHRPGTAELKQALEALRADYEGRGIELKEVAGGFRIQVRPALAPWIGRLWEEKPPRYSRALLETLALIAYRQPITRGEIEEIRGVSVSSSIIRTLLERDWVRVVGHREVPGRPAMYGTTRAFLDYFNLRTLDELPSLAKLEALAEGETAPLPLEPEMPAATATPVAMVDEAGALAAEVEAGEAAEPAPDVLH